MSKLQLTFLVIVALMNSNPALGSHDARDWVQIETRTYKDHVEIGSPDWNHPRHAVKRHKRMRKRIRNLESAVIQLQRELGHLRRKVAEQEAQHRHPSYSCYLKTPLNGTFLGQGMSLVSAKGRALRSCEKSGSFNCRETRLKCDQRGA